MLAKSWRLLVAAGSGYIADDSLSRGAAIAYYTVFSLAPVLVIVIAVAGLVFGEQAAHGAIVDEISGLMGQQGAAAIQTMIAGAANHRSGFLATGLGVAMLLITASGVFSEMQTALNVVWQAEPQSGTIARMVRVRLVGIGLVLALGFLLVVSLVVSTAVAALDAWFTGIVPAAHLLLRALSFGVSLALIAVLIGAIYKTLPDAEVAWRDAAVGALATAILFSIGKILIGLYLAYSSTASTFGAAGTLAVVLLWVYYSSQIFLFGAEFTRALAQARGSRAGVPAVAEQSTGHAELDALKAELRPAMRAR